MQILRVKQDVQLRHQFAQKELDILATNFIFRYFLPRIGNYKLSSKVKSRLINFILHAKHFLPTKTRFVNRCVLTGRSKVPYRKLRLSRMKLKEVLSKGLYSSFRKSRR